MSARTFLVTLVAVATMVIPAVAQGATIRVTSETRPLLGNREWDAGSTRSYTVAGGGARKLKASTALGQLVAATAFTSTRLQVREFSGLGAYVAGIGGVPVGAKGAWMLFVNGRASATGADSTVLKPSDRVLWVLDSDYSKTGPSVLDLVAEVRADGTVLFTARTTTGKGWRVAAGAAILIDGIQAGVTDAKGELVVTPTGDWDTAQATRAGAISSQLVIE